jgi:hypothetical protein
MTFSSLAAPWISNAQPSRSHDATTSEWPAVGSRAEKWENLAAHLRGRLNCGEIVYSDEAGAAATDTPNCGAIGRTLAPSVHFIFMTAGNFWFHI